MMLDIIIAFRLLFLSILSLPVAGNAPPTRQITIANNCTVSAWTFITTGAAGPCAAGCPTGSTCKTATSECMWDNPIPSTGKYSIGAKSKNVFTFVNDPNLPASMWSGNFAFCKQGTTCNRSPTDCDDGGCGPNGPSGSVVEFSIGKNITDYYDISLIGGVSISLQVSPDATQSTGANMPTDPYTCASLGSPQPSASGLGPSSWSFSPPADLQNSTDFIWVTPSSTPQNCSTDKDCTKAGEVCGLVLGNGTTTLTNVCGVLSGYWTPNAVCAASPGTSRFNCSDQKLLSYIQCANGAAQSCYSPNASDSCCGCVNWYEPEVLSAQLVPSATKKCTNSNNSYWKDNVLPGIKMIKEMCPNCYVYPFDDMSSTSTCMAEENGYNVQNYTITLCPNGPFPS